MMLTSFLGFAQQGQTAAPKGGSPYSMLIMMGLVFVIFYVLIIMPQRKKQKRHQLMVEELKPGAKIITTGGIYGTVMGVQKDKIELKVSANVKIDITKNAVGVIVSAKTTK